MQTTTNPSATNPATPAPGATTYLLRRPVGGVAPPRLDAAQRKVVEHVGGPLLVLAGPGTGKTTTMVEAIVDLVERRDVDPSQILALTFSRKAAEQLRDRVTARLGRALGTRLASTFHSFAYGLVRAHTDTEVFEAPLRVLSAAQQDVVVRDLLLPSPEAVRWPPELAEAVRTRGFAHELQLLLSRSRELGLDGHGLAAAGERARRPAWVAAGRFLEDYLDVLDAQSALDYSDLVARAVQLAEEPRVREELRRTYAWVFVDELQDTDPAQVALLQAIAGDGRNLVAVGDPDQSIYAFRGADLRGVAEFPLRFRTAAGDPAPTLALSTTRRFGPDLLAATRRVVHAIPRAGAIPAPVFDAFRDPKPSLGEHGPGVVEVLHADTARAEVEHIADLLRRAHLEDGVDWSDMAVLVRSGATSIPVLRRSLGAAGVPIEVAADDTPLTAEAAVGPLLEALRVTIHRDRTDPQDPRHVDADKAIALLSSPMGGLDAADLRLLGRALHRRARGRAAAAQDVDASPSEVSEVSEASGASGASGASRASRASMASEAPASSRDRIRAALLDPSLLEGLPASRAVDRARRLGRGLLRARHEVEAGASAEQVLWTLWTCSEWPHRLRAAATSGGQGAAAAHRDLDAICALFEEAAKAEEQRGHTSAESFVEMLSAQQLPADTLAERGVRGAAVRLMTAHRAKGLEWDVVVVAGVQEGAWPDLRRRSTLLGVDELTVHGAAPPLDPRALLAEERRLFYVACTRARRRLVVTAVDSVDVDAERASRFTLELGVAPRVVTGRPQRPLTLSGVVAELRRTVADESRPEPLRRAAARRLAALASERVGSFALVPAADPGSWWGLRERSAADRPLREEHEPVTLSGSTLEGLLTCPTRWFLDREVGVSSESTTSQGFGQIVHALADRLARGDLDDPDDLDDGVGRDVVGDGALEALMAQVDEVWELMPFRTPWSSAKERVQLRAALARLLAWHHRPDARRVLGTETEIRAEVRVGDEVVRLYGFADRLEVDAAGRVVVVDLKTAKSHPTKDQVAVHPQLGVYQLAVAHGAVDHLLGGPAEPGGAELVQLRGESAGVKVQRQEAPAPTADGDLVVERQLAEAVTRLRTEEFPARPGKHCDQCAFARLCPAQTAGTVLS